MNRNELLLNPGARDHLVQFYGEDSALADNVARYLKAGADRGDALCVIATEAHAALFLEKLRDLKVDGSALLREGILRLQDAQITLDGLRVGGALSWTRFDQTVGALAREMKLASRSGSLLAYGEMVDLLWKQGRLSDVSTLESYWNRLLESERVSLLCAYTLDLMDPRQDVGVFQDIVSPHSHLIPSRNGAQLHQAVRRAMETVLGEEASAALWPLVRANVVVQAALPEAERAILWFQRNLPVTARDLLKQAQAYCAQESAREPGGGKEIPA